MHSGAVFWLYNVPYDVQGQSAEDIATDYEEMDIAKWLRKHSRQAKGR